MFLSIFNKKYTLYIPPSLKVWYIHCITQLIHLDLHFMVKQFKICLYLKHFQLKPKS